MTREQFDKLKPYEQTFKYAVRMNFLSMGSGKFSELMAIYDELYEKPLTAAQTKCGTCRLNAVKRIGNDYFAFQQEIALKEKEERMKEAKTEDKPKKKSGRPPKINLDAEQ